MSDDTQEVELKGGHPPAVKVGGMRVATHQKHEKGDATPPPSKEEIEEYGTSVEKVDTHHQSVLVSGAVGKGDQDFRPEAIKAYHEKPLPTHDKQAHQKPNITKVFQPQKQ